MTNECWEQRSRPAAPTRTVNGAILAPHENNGQRQDGHLPFGRAGEEPLRVY